MFGFTLPIPASIENENDLPALGRLKTSVSIAEGYSVVKTLLTDDGNLFMLTRKVGALDAIWWSKLQPDGSYYLYLDVPIVTAESGFGAIGDFDYIQQIPGVSTNAYIAVGYPDCPILSLNAGSFSIRNSSIRIGSFALYAVQGNYKPAQLVSAGHDSVTSTWPGGIDAWVDFVGSFVGASAGPKFGYTVKFLYFNQTGGGDPVISLAVSAPYYKELTSAKGRLVVYEIADSNFQYYYDISKTFIAWVSVTELLNSKYLGLKLSTNCTYRDGYDSSGDKKYLAATSADNKVVLLDIVNNGGVGNYTTYYIDKPLLQGFGSNVAVNKDYLFVMQSQYTDVVGLSRIYVYSRSGTTWSETQSFSAPYVSSEVTFSGFGDGILVSDDSSILVITEPFRHTRGNIGQIEIKYQQAGSVHVYEKTSTYGSESNPYVYSYVQTLLPSSLNNNLKFGTNISLAPDTSKLDTAEVNAPSKNSVSVVSSNPSTVSVFVAGGFNGHVANDD